MARFPQNLNEKESKLNVYIFNHQKNHHHHHSKTTQTTCDDTRAKNKVNFSGWNNKRKNIRTTNVG
jgi:hypothetical protein